MMRRKFGRREFWVRISERLSFVHNIPFCTNNKPTNTTNSNNDSNKVNNGSLSQYDAYRDLDKLDFMTAAKILFTTPPKTKKFGIDFHLVQLFFVCMPSLAVYLVAQYARYEMRRMDAELELKKQAEEAKAKEMELKAAEEKAGRADPQILEVKVRLDKLEETVKEFVVESKKLSGSKISESQEGDGKRTSLGNNGNRSEPSNSAVEGHHNKQPSNKTQRSSGQQETNPTAIVTDAFQKDQKVPQDGRPSQDEKK